jgi:UDP-glucose 4-epimerase
VKVLVTGGAGFIGSHVVDAYLAAGHDVAVVDDLSSGNPQNVHPQARFYRFDIRDSRLDEVFARERPDVVSHQAARANVRESLDKPLLYADVNVLGSLNILECCRRHAVSKVIYASTGGAVYGEPRVLPVTEEHPVNPLDPYGASKHHVEHYLDLYQANFGIDFTVLRYPNVYGPRQNAHGEAGVIAIFTREMLERCQPLINGTGEQQRDFVYVSDIACANVLAVERGNNRIFNLGSGVGTTINHVFDVLARLTGYDRAVARGPAKQGEVFQVFLDASLAQAELDWATQVDLETGLALTVRDLEQRLSLTPRAYSCDGTRSSDHPASCPSDPAGR